MLAAVGAEVDEQRWGHAEELLAVIAELLSALYRFTVQIHSKERAPVPDLFHYPRPSERSDEPEEEPERPTRHTFRRALLGGGNV